MLSTFVQFDDMIFSARETKGKHDKCKPKASRQNLLRRIKILWYSGRKPERLEPSNKRIKKDREPIIKQRLSTITVMEPMVFFLFRSCTKTILIDPSGLRGLPKWMTRFLCGFFFGNYGDSTQ